MAFVKCSVICGDDSIATVYVNTCYVAMIAPATKEFVEKHPGKNPFSVFVIDHADPLMVIAREELPIRAGFPETYERDVLAEMLGKLVDESPRI